jgi:hypothetical protein
MQIVRGALNKPISIDGVVLPANARLQLQVVCVGHRPRAIHELTCVQFQGVLQPLEYLNVTLVPSGAGLHFLFVRMYICCMYVYAVYMHLYM